MGVHSAPGGQGSALVPLPGAAAGADAGARDGDQPLPLDWERKTDGSGRVFYVDHHSRVSQWHHPGPVADENAHGNTAHRAGMSAQAASSLSSPRGTKRTFDRNTAEVKMRLDAWATKNAAFEARLLAVHDLTGAAWDVEMDGIEQRQAQLTLELAEIKSAARAAGIEDRSGWAGPASRVVSAVSPGVAHG